MSMLCYSIGLEDHLHKPMVYFHRLGLWGSDVVDSRNWTLNKLSTIRSKLRHTEVTFRIINLPFFPGDTMVASICFCLSQGYLCMQAHAVLSTSACTCTCTCGDKGGSLQLRSLRYFRTTVTTAAVCLQRRRSSRILRKEVGAHNSTSP